MLEGTGQEGKHSTPSHLSLMWEWRDLFYGEWNLYSRDYTGPVNKIISTEGISSFKHMIPPPFLLLLRPLTLVSDNLF